MHGLMYKIKARCVERGDEKESGVNFNAETLYATVEIYKGILILIPYAVSMGLTIEGSNVPNEYIFGKLDMPVYLEQSCRSSGKKVRPGLICRLQKYIYTCCATVPN